MPGKNNSSSFHAQHVTDYAIYRASLAANDNLADPSLVTSVIDASAYPSALGLQIWITPQRVSGTGTVDLTLVFENNGSLAVVAPYKTIGTNAGIASLQESRFTGLTAGRFRVLATNMDPGSVWTLHFALTTSLGISIPVTPGGAGVWGSITGTLTDQLDLVSALGVAGGTAAWGSVSGTLSSQADLNSALTVRHVVIPTSTTYYVRTDGNDANTGTVNTAGGAWLTVQHAVDVVSTYVIPTGVVVTIQIGDGTYAESVILHRFTGGGTVILNGNAGTPANVVIAGNVRSTENSVGYTVQAFRAAPTAGGSTLLVDRKAIMTMGAGMIIAGTVTTAHIVVNSDGYLRISGNYTIASAAPAHWYVTRGSVLEITTAITLTITGTPAWSSAFLAADTGASVVPFGLTVSGASTGPRYSVALNAVCQTFGGGADYLPGNSAGSTSTGGQYA